MGAGVPEEDSNSQNANTIVEIQTGAGGGRRVVLSSGSSFFASASNISAQGLTVGSICTDDHIRELIRIDQIRKIIDKAYEYLSRRDHSVFEISKKLTQKGYDAEYVASATVELQNRGHLDDGRFAESWLRNRLSRHPEGTPRLIAGLRARGIERRIVDQTISAVLDEETAINALSDAAEKLLRRKKNDPDKLLRALVQRGFSYRAVTLYLKNKHIAEEKDN